MEDAAGVAGRTDDQIIKPSQTLIKRTGTPAEL
jgi:hypothetical protein